MNHIVDNILQKIPPQKGYQFIFYSLLNDPDLRNLKCDPFVDDYIFTDFKKAIREYPYWIVEHFTEQHLYLQENSELQEELLQEVAERLPSNLQSKSNIYHIELLRSQGLDPNGSESDASLDLPNSIYVYEIKEVYFK